jgi:hypothetical protein
MNTQTQEALKIALESHKNNERHNTNAETKYWCEQYRMLCEKILEALEQPAQEPVGYIEPADLESVPDGDTGLWFAKQDERYSIAIYTHPHQWQGLTDDEIHNIADYSFPFPSEMFAEIFAFARAIEQALKEKNHG